MPSKIDSIFRTMSQDIGVKGISDQYADGKAAKIWQKYIGDTQKRTGTYRDKFIKILKDHGVKNVLDVACGTGVDSILLLEEGFNVTSVDASDKMLKYALKTRWERRKENAFDQWVIEEGNWLSLKDADITLPEGGFDAVIIMGNSFAHLPDFDGDQQSHITAIANFRDALKPGGILVIDHRNYDHIVTGGKPPMKNIYYGGHAPVDVKTSVVIVDSKYHEVTLDYTLRQEEEVEEDGMHPSYQKRKREVLAKTQDSGCFRLSYYPHLLATFNKVLIENVFGSDADHTVLADFEPLDKVENPAYYIHIVQKNKKRYKKNYII